jgi:Zn ribbon nucleic-acid-binding protein
MRGFFRGRRECVNCEYSPFETHKSIRDSGAANQIIFS